MVKFEFPFADNQEPLFLEVNTPLKGDEINIYHENGKVTSYCVGSITYHLRNVNGMLFGSGDSTVCVKLKRCYG